MRAGLYCFLQTEAKSLNSDLELVQCYLALIKGLYIPVPEVLGENWGKKDAESSLKGDSAHSYKSIAGTLWPQGFCSEEIKYHPVL